LVKNFFLSAAARRSSEERASKNEKTMPRDFARRGGTSTLFNPYANVSVLTQPLPSDYHLHFRDVSSSLYSPPASNSFVVHPLSFPAPPGAWRGQYTAALQEGERERAKDVALRSREQEAEGVALSELNDGISYAEYQRNNHRAIAEEKAAEKEKRRSENPEAPYTRWELANFQADLDKPSTSLKKSVAKRAGNAGTKSAFDDVEYSFLGSYGKYGSPFDRTGILPSAGPLFGGATPASPFKEFEDISWTQEDGDFGSPIPYIGSPPATIGTTTPLFYTPRDSSLNIIDVLERESEQRRSSLDKSRTLRGKEIDNFIEALQGEVLDIENRIQQQNEEYHGQLDMFLRHNEQSNQTDEEIRRLEKQFQESHQQYIQGLYIEKEELEKHIAELSKARYLRGRQSIEVPNNDIVQRLLGSQYVSEPSYKGKEKEKGLND